MQTHTITAHKLTRSIKTEFTVNIEQASCMSDVFSLNFKKWNHRVEKTQYQIKTSSFGRHHKNVYAISDKRAIEKQRERIDVSELLHFSLLHRRNRKTGRLQDF